MKILQINNHHYGRGGADKIYLNTARLLQKNGFDVICVSQGEADTSNDIQVNYTVPNLDWKKKFDSRLDLILSAPRFLYSIKNLFAFILIIVKERPDIAHVHLYKGGMTSAIFTALKIFRIPAVLQSHDYGIFCPVNICLDGERKICDKCLHQSKINGLINRCNRNRLVLSLGSVLEFYVHSVFAPRRFCFGRVIASSKFQYSLLARIPYIKKQLLQIYNFVPEDLCRDSNDHKFSGYYLYIGRLAAEKGVKTLIEAYCQSGVKRGLKIVGNGPEYNNLVEIPESYGNKTITFEGYKSGDELLKMIDEAYFVIVPSEWYENNPMSVLESYARTKPVIGAKIAGITEIIEDGVSGFLFEPFSEVSLREKLILSEFMTITEYTLMCRNSFGMFRSKYSEESHLPQLKAMYLEMQSNRVPDKK
jgi:glycosyltransferase involved in cell wall biosynthesis